MRIWQMLVVIFVLACVFGIARTQAGRVAVVMLFTGVGEVILGTMAVMHLFRTVGSIGQARTLQAYLEGLVATLLVLLAASASMNFLFWIGGSLLQFLLSD